MKRITVAASLSLCAFMISCKNETVVLAEEIKENPVTDSVKADIPIAEKLVGNWVEPNPINPEEDQGIELLKDGKAKSINMETLKYEQWWIQNDKLVLVETSIGNHLSGTDTMIYAIGELTDSSLVLQDGDRAIKYRRK